MTTIQLPVELLAQIKIYCAVREIKIGIFVSHICSNDKEFQNFIKKNKFL